VLCQTVNVNETHLESPACILLLALLTSKLFELPCRLESNHAAY
jgi:hypothetical protein